MELLARIGISGIGPSFGTSSIAGVGSTCGIGSPAEASSTSFYKHWLIGTRAI